MSRATCFSGTSSDAQPPTEQAIDALLARLGLVPGDDERRVLAGLYAAARRTAALIADAPLEEDP